MGGGGAYLMILDIFGVLFHFHTLLGPTLLLERSWTSIFHYFGVTVPAFLCSSTLQGTAFLPPPLPPPPKLGGVKLYFWALFGL